MKISTSPTKYALTFSAALLFSIQAAQASEGFQVGIEANQISVDSDSFDRDETEFSFFAQNKFEYNPIDFQVDFEYGEYLDEGFLQMAAHFSYDITPGNFVGALIHYAAPLNSSFDDGVTLTGIEGGATFGEFYVNGSLVTDISDESLFDSVINIDAFYDADAYVDGLGAFAELTSANYAEDTNDTSLTAYLVGASYEIASGFSIRGGIGQYLVDTNDGDDDAFNAQIALVWGGERNLVARQRAVTQALTLTDLLAD